MKKVILFDLDGTLIDSTQAIVGTFRHAFEVQGDIFEGSDEDIKGVIGYPLDIMFGKLGVPQNKVWDFVDSYKLRYRVISKEQTLLLDQARKAVEHASTFARLGIVTTKTGLYSKELMVHLDLMHHFECLIGREDVQNPKPHPEPILTALKQMEIDKNNYEVWMIGDTKLDLIAAQEAQINSFGVLCGYGNSEDLKQYTSNIEHSTHAAVQIIEKC